MDEADGPSVYEVREYKKSECKKQKTEGCMICKNKKRGINGYEKNRYADKRR